MNKEFTCSICGEVLNSLDKYLTHVQECVAKENEKARREQELKYVVEVDAAIKKVRTAESYYEACLNDFKAKYPKEYVLNFANESVGVDHNNKTVDELLAEANELIAMALDKAHDENMSPEMLMMKVLLD